MIKVIFDNNKEHVWIRNIIDNGVLNSTHMAKDFEAQGINTEQVVSYRMNLNQAPSDHMSEDAKRNLKELFGVSEIGEISDGYHTFNELYDHRAVLFSVICSNYKTLAWKSKLHHDGSMYPGMFIVGIDTPSGQATYHYHTDTYWDMFDVAELEKAPLWDGHSPSEALQRIASLRGVTIVEKQED